jgi:WD40 repeat protein
LTDFGLAKDLADDTTTKQGNILGSPAYMSPEQARGDAFRSDRRTDVYSLGVLLYEMLTGQRPFQGAADAVLHQVIYAQVTRPRRISGDIPLDLETICLKAISKEPASRYETAQHMADDLQRYLNGEPIAARSMPWVQQGWRWCIRNRALSAAMAMAVALLVFLAVAGPFVAVQMKKNADAMAILSRDTRRSLYVSDMSSAYNAWENLSNYRRTKDILDKYEPADNQEELRGFEWYLLREMTQVENRFETGHSINGLDVSPDGRLVAVTGPGSTALWNLETRKLERTFEGPFETGRAIAFSPDGTQVVSNDLTTVRIWTVVDGKLFSEEKVKGIWSVDFSPDGASVALGLLDGSVRLMDIKSGEQTILGQHVAPVDRTSKGTRVYHLSFSQDGSRLLSTSWTGRANIWNLASNDEAVTLQDHEWWARQGAFSPDGSLCATTDVESIKIWNSRSGELLTTIPHFGAESVAFSADGQTIACGTWLNEIRLFNLAGKALSTLRGHSALVHAIAFSANGQLITGGKDGVVCSWDHPLRDGNRLVDIESSIRYAAISNAARFAVLTCEDGSAHVLDADTGEAISKFDFDANRIRVAIRPDDEMLAFNDGKEVLLKRYPSLQDAVKIPAGSAILKGIAFSPDGQTLAVGDAAGKITFWASDTGNQQSELQLQVPEISSIAYSMKGELIGAAGKNQAQYWSTTTPEKPTLLEVPGSIRTIRFSPDGKLVAAACQDNFIYLWNTQDGRAAAVLRGHGTYVMSLAFATDGRTLVSGSADANIKFWNLITMEEMISIRAHAGTVTSLNFSADGKTLMSTGWGCPGKPATAVLWRIE